MNLNCDITAASAFGEIRYCVGTEAAAALGFSDLHIGESIWVPLISAIIGGALAVGASYWATSASLKGQRRAREEEVTQNSAEKAYSAFFKLLDSYNLLANLKLHIDKQFALAKEEGMGDAEPWKVLTQTVGEHRAPKEIDPSETAFLISLRKADLLNDVHLISTRVANTVAVMQAYNAHRADLHKLLETSMEKGLVIEGGVMGGEFSQRVTQQISIQGGRLNLLISNIREMLDADIPFTWRATEEFQKAARTKFGDRFPNFDLDNKIG
ncbi:hypothetical protein [Paracoccus sp. KR1-242]|uniref:hypothetical protein n=1 Tax=Paracoccus sp. KR1-242 TaxID=3410028 RepID=UPI003C04B11E